MKAMKKLFAVVLAVALAVAMAIPAFAADGDSYSITINDTKGIAADQFSAYQVFSGTLSNDGKTLSDIQWGSGIDAAKIVALQTALGVTSAQEAAEKLSDGTIKAEDFADVVNGYLSDTHVDGTATDGSSVTISVGTPGYYFVKNSGEATEGQAYTKFILQVLGEQTVNVKTDAPSVEKKVKNADEPDEAYRDANNVAIGDTVNYRITSNVPDVSNYKNYNYIINDTMSKGLTYTEGSLKVKLGDTELAEGTAYTLTPTVNNDGTTSLKVDFGDAYQLFLSNKGVEISVTYSAVLNENAVIGNTGNPNEVDLTYSNNPNDANVTGTTPKDYTITYTNQLGVFKYDGSNLAALDGVTFRMVGLKNNDVTKITQTFTESASGTYYQLKNGSYTTVEPTDVTSQYYASTTTKYEMTTTAGTYTESVDKYDSGELTTGANGYVTFDKLAEGTYQILEIKTKDGYNMLTSPLTVEIKCTVPDTVVDGTEKATWTVTVDGNDVTAALVDGAQNGPSADTLGNVAAVVNVANNAGSTLPSTGGIGTTIFYVVGGVLVVGAVVLLVAKKRTSREG